jgi:dihydrofolate synthase/folylpolyglutamate synthase
LDDHRDLTDFASSLNYLFARTTGTFKFGLERTRALLAELGEPHLSYPVLHVAGTNGKGSSVATAEALLRARGLRVARYTSPHLVDFRERIVVDGRPIGAEEIVAFVRDRMPLIERIGASFFEATTAMAFVHFALQEVDVALIEAGLGGRLDSTNVVMPRAAGVTSIGFDHMEYLGDTLEAIAREKAGIFKKDVPAVIGEPDPHIRTLLAEHARAVGASDVRIVAEESEVRDLEVLPRGTQFTLDALKDSQRINTPLVGRHQAANFAFTVTLLDAAGAPFATPLKDAARSVANVSLPGRFQRDGKIIFDVAHNADGARTLAASLASVAAPGPVVAVLCVLGDKDWRGMMDALAAEVDVYVLTDAPTAPKSRAWSLTEAAAYAEQRGYAARVEPDFGLALDVALATGETVLITGSFHTAGDAMARLAVSPLTG